MIDDRVRFEAGDRLNYEVLENGQLAPAPLKVLARTASPGCVAGGEQPARVMRPAPQFTDGPNGRFLRVSYRDATPDAQVVIQVLAGAAFTNSLGDVRPFVLSGGRGTVLERLKGGLAIGGLRFDMLAPSRACITSVELVEPSR